MPERNVIPKPKQKPHPPLWVACSMRETVFLAARLGIGALGFDFVDTEESRPASRSTGASSARSANRSARASTRSWRRSHPFMCHPDDNEAVERGLDGARFFMFALAHYYGGPPHQPGKPNIWEDYKNIGRTVIDAMRKARQQARTGYSPERRRDHARLRRLTGLHPRAACARSRRPGSTRSSSFRRPAAISTSTSWSRWSCSRRKSCPSSKSASRAPGVAQAANGSPRTRSRSVRPLTQSVGRSTLRRRARRALVVGVLRVLPGLAFLAGRPLLTP